jgi:hypothetical protein
VIAEPPVEAGAVQDTVTSGATPNATPGTLVAVTPVGAPGVLAGVTALDGAEGALVPVMLVAVTVNV